MTIRPVSPATAAVATQTFSESAFNAVVTVTRISNYMLLRQAARGYDRLHAAMTGCTWLRQATRGYDRLHVAKTG